MARTNLSRNLFGALAVLLLALCFIGSSPVKADETESYGTVRCHYYFIEMRLMICARDRLSEVRFLHSSDTSKHSAHAFFAMS